MSDDARRRRRPPASDCGGHDQLAPGAGASLQVRLDLHVVTSSAK
jgi:hypothetical protein